MTIERNKTNTQAAKSGERKPNGRKAASVETSLTVFHFSPNGRTREHRQAGEH